LPLPLLHTQLALGSILRQGKARELPCGVFGSFGWSGEAVDEMEAKLKDGGYGFAFDPIKVKFKPNFKVC
jgi:flavorubredoxin